MWLREPPTPHPTHLLELSLILGLVFYANIISNEVLNKLWHIPFQLGILGIALFIARAAGTTWTAMGMRNDRLRSGARVGGTIVALVAIALLIGVAVPHTRELFRDDEIAEASVAWVLFHGLVRIPIATALYEEVLFRGIVFGMLMHRHRPLVAGILTSVLFGFWHILPTLDAIDTSPVGTMFSGPVGSVVVVAGSVLGTAVAGIGFLLVRLYANSTLAAVLVHIGTNSLGLLLSLVVIRLL
jgi:membrane protease YdiL (CAAX protease family)